jgi:hypothetical protein
VLFRSGYSYAGTTVRKAKSELQTSRRLSPSGMVQAAEPKQAPNWIGFMRLWANGKTGIGSSAKNVYMLHLNAAILKENFDPAEGTWSPEYFLPQAELLSRDISVARSKQTVVRAHELLKAVGLLRLVRAGSRRSGDATVWKVRVPSKDEREPLASMGVAAASVLRQARGRMNGRVRRDMKTAAKDALNAPMQAQGSTHSTLASNGSMTYIEPGTQTLGGIQDGCRGQELGQPVSLSLAP